MWDTDDEDESFDEDDDDSDGSGDGWMVSEDERGGVAEGKRSQSPAVGPGGVIAGGEEQEMTFLSAKKGKGKEKEKEKSAKKKKTVMVPVVKGPFFEVTLGVCGWDGFDGYRIQMLNGESLLFFSSFVVSVERT